MIEYYKKFNVLFNLLVDLIKVLDFKFIIWIFCLFNSENLEFINSH